MFWADQCGIVSLWPPEGFVCLLQEDSLDPLMSHLDGMQKKLKLEEFININSCLLHLLETAYLAPYGCFLTLAEPFG